LLFFEELNEVKFAKNSKLGEIKKLLLSAAKPYISSYKSFLFLHLRLSFALTSHPIHDMICSSMHKNIR